MAHKRGTQGLVGQIIFSVNSSKINEPSAQRILKERQGKEKKRPIELISSAYQTVCASVTAELQLNGSKFILASYFLSCPLIKQLCCDQPGYVFLDTISCFRIYLLLTVTHVSSGFSKTPCQL